jgi:hypothetical protein
VQVLYVDSMVTKSPGKSLVAEVLDGIDKFEKVKELGCSMNSVQPRMLYW